MARTAHHPSHARRRTRHDMLTGQPWYAVVLRAVEVYAFPRYQSDATVGRWAAVEERRARQRLRRQAGVVLRLVNAPGGAVDVDAADLVDIPPARHRRSGLWFA
ncbi:hypothetical protein [Streptomyces lateritius]|uniref:hypothetical protein n=1 Tax=Streptomyces lateritius TaxID=67313 RepID=UPI0021AB8CC8|nr:hypothetical protein [Streptomyces lateritius]